MKEDIMKRFEILCVTMHQKDFSKISEMNVHSNVVFANQSDETSYQEKEFDGNIARMITTATRGVGKNRNIALTYADADIVLFSDDDVFYNDDAEERVLAEFDAHPDADIIIFHFESTSAQRQQRAYPKTRKHRKGERMPWGALRIALRLTAQKKANLWFSTLFGGGCIFPCGEDSMWLTDAKRAGLTFYVSKETIGKVSMESSTWYTGVDEKYYYGKGAFYQAMHPRTKYLWMLYFALRTKSPTLSFKNKIKWMKAGVCGYRKMQPYAQHSSKSVS